MCVTDVLNISQISHESQTSDFIVLLMLSCFLFQVSFTDPDSPYYCKRNVYVVCSVLAIVMILGGISALVILGWIRVVDTRRRKRHNNQVKGL